jgi:hypothetical protein
VDGAGTGRTFDCIGGLSGGGGTSRLLYDYPAQQQSEILDYLFKPNYGASLQILKVEIGGDVDTTNGAEASHERSATDANYHRGYEWWLMQQAKARNPNIKLYGLQWGTPGWVNGTYATAYNWYSTADIPYVVDWLTNAQSVYGLTIDYVGGQNEGDAVGYPPYFEALKSAITAAGLTTKIVATDTFDSWAIATALNSTPAYAAAVDVLGTHYPCGYPPGSQCNGTPNLSDALTTGKPLWASEEGSLPFDTGGISMARYLNNHYIQAKMTASINWSLAGAWYSNLPYGGTNAPGPDGLLAANQPWSGYYVVDKSIWANAHTTQFVQPGWQYIDTASADVSGVGSYVSLKAPNGKDWSVILETMDATAPTTFTFVETGGIFEGPVHVWGSSFAAGSTSANWFVKQPDITPTGCTFTFIAQPNSLYSFTSTTGQAKGSTTPPASATFAIPYTDSFESYTVGAMPNIPKYFSTVEGAFEVENCVGGRTGKCVQQEIVAAPSQWNNVNLINPVTIVGDPGWTNYKVSVDALLQQAGTVDLIGRIAAQLEFAGAVEGYHFSVTDTGAWTLASQAGIDSAGTTTNTTLKSGTTTFGTNTWHTLALDFNGTTITASLDGTALATVTDSTYTKGNAGLSTSQWNDAQFDNFSVTAP